MSWRGPLAVFFFLAAEALLWFIVLRSFATALEREALREAARAIRLGISDGDFLQPDRARDAQVLAERAAESAIGGPPLLVLIAVAIGAFALMRLLAKTELPVSSRAAVGLLVSFAGVGLALQLALAEGAPWEGGILADLRGEGASTFSSEIDPAAFVADPDLDRVRGASRTVTIVGVSLIWLRFLFAGRGPVTFERSLRSFGVGFGVAVVAAFLASASDADVASWLVMPYFVLGALSLATAHAARAPEDDTALHRDAPWAISVLGTLALLTALTVFFALVTLLEAQRLLEPVGSLLLTIVAWTLIIVLTPIVWLLELLLDPILNDVQFPNVQTEIEQVVSDEEDDDRGGFRFPGWIVNVARGAVAVAALWIAYRVGRWLFERSQRSDSEEYEETRAAEGGGGLGAMLRALIPRPRGRRRADWSWLDRSRAYRLFGRMLSAAHLRGIERSPGQTALEFGVSAGERLEAPPFAAIADAFDGSRYGRHEPSPERLATLEREFARWEGAHPPPEVEPAPAAPEDEDERG